MASPGGTETYTYSAEGLRQKKETAGGTTCYVYDGTNVLLETDASLVTQANYVDTPDAWGFKSALHRSGGSAFYLPDHQGTNRQLTDAGQAVTDTLLTDAWGVEVARSGATVNPFAAFGQWGYYRDTANRLYVRARHLRVDMGRWVSRDPVRSSTASVGSYVYVEARPLAASDPTGLFSCWWCLATVLQPQLAPLCALYCGGDRVQPPRWEPKPFPTPPPTSGEVRTYAQCLRDCHATDPRRDCYRRYLTCLRPLTERCAQRDPNDWEGFKSCVNASGDDCQTSYALCISNGQMQWKYCLDCCDYLFHGFRAWACGDPSRYRDPCGFLNKPTPDRRYV